MFPLRDSHLKLGIGFEMEKDFQGKLCASLVYVESGAEGTEHRGRQKGAMEYGEKHGKQGNAMAWLGQEEPYRSW